MGPENQNPLDELQSLDEQIGQTTELAALKPIFFRLDELAKAHPSDFEVQLAVTELKQKVVTRGTALKQMGQTMEGAVPGSAHHGNFDHSPQSGSTSTETLRSFTEPVTPPAPAAPTVSSAFQAPPVAPAGDISSPPPPPPARPAGDGATWKRALLLGVIAGAVVSVLVLVV